MERELDLSCNAGIAPPVEVVNKAPSWEAMLPMCQFNTFATLNYNLKLRVVTGRMRSLIQATVMSFLRRGGGGGQLQR